MRPQRLLKMRKRKEEIPPAERSLLQKIIRKGLVVNKNNVKVQCKDPNFPLYSVKSFEALDLKPELLKGVHAMRRPYLLSSLIQLKT
ncbi:hypothetical protein J437_LFUL002022 [Ladona fulva]|uniref:Uncharacterized protein n=1 Tax=Ladona fulva TaxID=123851 RepID=A0A8K0JVF9_LADFU|nr:hypothetical protein J437_LFUL002022 [Ladona fulva]